MTEPTNADSKPAPAHCANRASLHSLRDWPRYGHLLHFLDLIGGQITIQMIFADNVDGSRFECLRDLDDLEAPINAAFEVYKKQRKGNGEIGRP